jgi:P-type E1-E2 ATPase
LFNKRIYRALAGVDVLCSDKTGTLTKNKLTIHDPYVVSDSSLEEIMGVASLACVRKRKGADAIDKAIIKATRRQCPEEWRWVLRCHVCTCIHLHRTI